MGPGWRHSYGRSINANYQPTQVAAYPGQSSTVSAQYADAATACASGFADVQASVGAWSSATAAYTNNVCVVSNSGGAIATLTVKSLYLDAPVTAPAAYDVIRDDGQIFRFTTQGGSINNPPGVSLRLAVTGSGFTVTDNQDNVEVYNSSGVLQSITTRAGLVQTVSYDINGLLSGVTDGFGNQLTVTRNTPRQLVGVSVNNSVAVQFAYDSAYRLSKITNSDATTRTFGYTDPNFPNALTSEIDEAGITYATWTYDTQERGKTSSLALGANAVSLDYNGNATSVTDALGAFRVFTFGRSGDRVPVTTISGDPCHSCADAAATTYDAAGWVASRTDYNGNLTCYANDPVRGLELIRIEGFELGDVCPTDLASYIPATGTAQRKIATAWHTVFRLPTLITESTRTTSFGYDNSTGNLLTRTVTDTTASPNVSRTWTYTYNGFGQVLTVQSPRTDLNSTRTYTYWTCTTGTQCGQVHTVTDEVGQVTTFNTYNVYGQPLMITDPNGVVTTLTYDTRRRLTSRTVGGEETIFAYYPIGPIKKATLADGSNLNYTYDDAHRLTKIQDGLGNSTQYVPDLMGNVLGESTYDPSNTLATTHSRTFDVLSELHQDIAAAGTSAVTTTYGYDSEGNLKSVAAPLLRNTTPTYDALNRVTKIKDPGTGITQFSYDANDQLASVTDPRTLVTQYTNDGFGVAVTDQVSPDTGTTLSTYDSAGNLHTVTDARGAVGTYTYDAMNRPTHVQFAGSGATVTKSLTYDSCTYGKGRLCQRADQAGVTSWTYTAQGRIASRTEVDGASPVAPAYSPGGTYTLNYGYNTAGQRTSLQLPSGSTISYTYNGNNRVSGLSVTVNGVSTPILSGAAYEPFGAVKGWTWGNGATVIRSHNQDGNVSVISSTGLHLSYGYDNAQRINAETDLDTPVLSWTYGYDRLDRLTSATVAAGTQGWTYDANGNRLTQTGTLAAPFLIFPQTLTYDTASNQFEAWTNHNPVQSDYDAAGYPQDYHGYSFPFDAEGNASGSSTQYYTNGAQQRVADVQFGEEERRVYDDEGHVLGEYDWDPDDFPTAPLLPLQETIWLGDLPVAVIMAQSTFDANGAYTGWQQVLYYVHADHLNTPRRLTRPVDNVVVWRWDSDAFGNGPPNSNPQGSPATAVIYNLRFPGQYYDSETGLNYNQQRDYDPATGRYVESDPIGIYGGINTYAYVGGNPLSRIDPTGRFFVSPGFLGGWGAETLGAAAGPLGAAIGAFGVGYEIGTLIYNGIGVPLQDALQVPYDPNAGGGGYKPPRPPASTTGGCPPEEPRKFSPGKSPGKWANQMQQRGWTLQQIEDAIQNGQSFPAQNNINPVNGATRYVSPETGQSVVIDNATGEVIHVGGPGFKY